MRRVILGLLAVVLLATALAELYQAARALIGAAWLAALAVNATFAVIVVALGRPSKREARSPSASKFFLVYGPALFIVVGAAALGLATSGGTARSNVVIPGETWAMIAAVPIVEEWLFRVGFGRWYRGACGPWLGAYLGALTFAMVHSDATIGGWLSGRTGIVPGPLLLGIACELLYRYTGSVTAIILLHGACNATPTLFALTDPRWLDWLGFLYL